MHLRAFSPLENQERLVGLDTRPLKSHARDWESRPIRTGVGLLTMTNDLFAATLKSANLSSRSGTLDAVHSTDDLAIVRIR
jgi:hypothetical protein